MIENSGLSESLEGSSVAVAMILKEHNGAIKELKEQVKQLDDQLNRGESSLSIRVASIEAQAQQISQIVKASNASTIEEKVNEAKNAMAMKTAIIAGLAAMAAGLLSNIDNIVKLF